MSRAETATQTAALAEKGMTVVAPSPELMAGLKEIGAAMLEGWKAQAGENGAAILSAYGK